jgi:hypothetical protein
MYEHDDDGVLLGGDPASDPGPDSLQLGAGIAAALIVELDHGKFVVPKLKMAARSLVRGVRRDTKCLPSCHRRQSAIRACLLPRG